MNQTITSVEFVQTHTIFELRDINTALDQIKRNDEDGRDVVSNELEESAKLLNFHVNEIKKAENNGVNTETI